jgi:hypothetical protein
MGLNIAAALAGVWSAHERCLLPRMSESYCRSEPSCRVRVSIIDRRRGRYPYVTAHKGCPSRPIGQGDCAVPSDCHSKYGCAGPRMSRMLGEYPDAIVR